MHQTLRLSALLLLCALEATAQKAGTDCKDPVPFSRPDHFTLESCNNHYGSYRFRVKPGQPAQPMLGTATTYRYVYNSRSGTPAPGAAQVLNSYQQVITSNDGKVVYADTDEGSFTMIRDGKEYWVNLDFTKTSGDAVTAYALVMLEKKVPQARKAAKR